MRMGDERGQVLPMVAVMTLGLLAMVGLVVDAGVMFSAKRELQSTVDAAARAGAAVIDQEVYRSSGGRTVVLDQGAARQAALRRLQQVHLGDLRVSDHSVYVRAFRSQPLLLLSLVGVGPLHVEADSTARPRTGILAPGG
jgi:Putative Flp pilus-assembly TadE/G-like